MRLRQALVPLSLVVVVAIMLVGLRSGPRATMSPFLKMGGQAIPSGIASPGYGLFGCQLGLSSATCYDPYQMRTAYGTDRLIASGFDGHGKTIVIVDAFQSPNIVSQLNHYDAFYELPGLNGLGNPDDPTLGTFTQIAPDGLTPFVSGDDNMTGWAAEISLDVLWAHAIAPGANITLVLAKSNDDADILNATKYAVDHGLGDVISQSFGENESCMDSTLLVQQHQLFADATMKGITLFASAGDTGAAQPTCDGSSYVKAASSPASDPLVTAVGGTELHAAGYCLTVLGCDPTANPAPGTYEGEIAWNEFDSSSGTGGGFSVLYDEPPFQQGTIHGGKQRGAPDVSYSAAVEHGVLTYLDIPGIPAGMYLFGGTSAGSPQWAAILAIADQMAGRSLGFINRSLYDIGQAQQHYAASLRDVTSGNNSFAADLDNDGTIDVTVEGFNAGPGWDPTTGLGSPNMAGLANYLVLFNSPGDGAAAVATTKPHPNGRSNANGHMNPHASR
ncbi:MAG: S8 family serine peptidase [Betaproteobacteria bacterium]